MTKSVFFFFFSLLLLLEATSATASSRNATTSELRYGGCVPGVTVGECITAMIDEEEDEVEAVVRRILQPKRYLGYRAVGQRQRTCNGNIVANCLRAVSKKGSTCTLYDKCKRYP